MTPEVRAARVRAVVEAARRLSSADDPLGREARRALPAATGLSPEGVDLALARCIETHAEDDEIDALVASVPPAPRVHVVLSANVFVAAARALALAVAAAPEVVVRASRREPVTAALLCQALAERSDPVEVTLSDTVHALPGEHVHAYGRRESLEAIRRSLPAGASFWGHGPGIGLAIVTEHDDAERAAERLSWDVALFDQRGCLSPRIVLYPGRASGAHDLARRLSAALDAREREFPRGRLAESELSLLALYARTVEMVGSCIQRPAHLVGVDPEARSIALPPAGRNVHVACVTGEACEWLSALAPAITMVGRLADSSLFAHVTSLAPWARRSQLGEMQMPPLDGPVDRRARVERVR